ncbi:MULTISPECIES: hypothetical protein [unclassified Pseudomonas]|uniref:hypothetical protein n=1 Tax=unclassified Pseudomonas TaxID=196821 RepID=UPI000C881FD5|nr:MULTISPECIES: hypothetical protein [unclassified Pseudomonas]PMZ88694.1 hypothetical protein C1X61_12905 [Pseudomonas sp. FW215-T2]PNA10693.1 hypothetical protein C1X62_17800 [Pseudomonas sp. FW215-R3]PNB36669.1 hypothetical protein C1X63_16095 [Pseudomonas sp. FW305-131]
MIKKRITNPMTIIAIFAALSETSAAVSLPFLDQEERELYVWFLISFPFYLLLLFFATLNFNYKSLYAPSDFEKGKHFMKVMDDVGRSEKKASAKPSENPTLETSANDWQSARTPCGAQDPPTGIGLQTVVSVQHHLQLPEPVKDLYIVDVRWMSEEVEFGALLEKIQRPREKTAHVILFVTCAVSEKLLKASALGHTKQASKRGAAFYVTYNLDSHRLSVIDHAGQPANSNL